MSPLGPKLSARGGEKPPSTLYFRFVRPPLVTRRTRSTCLEGPSQNFSNPPTPASQAQLPLTLVVEFCSVSRYPCFNLTLVSGTKEGTFYKKLRAYSLILVLIIPEV